MNGPGLHPRFRDEQLVRADELEVAPGELEVAPGGVPETGRSETPVDEHLHWCSDCANYWGCTSENCDRFAGEGNNCPCPEHAYNPEVF